MALNKFGDRHFSNILVSGLGSRFKYSEIEAFIEHAPTGAQAVLESYELRKKATGVPPKYCFLNYAEEIINKAIPSHKQLAGLPDESYLIDFF